MASSILVGSLPTLVVRRSAFRQGSSHTGSAVKDCSSVGTERTSGRLGALRPVNAFYLWIRFSSHRWKRSLGLQSRRTVEIHHKPEYAAGLSLRRAMGS